MSVALRPHPYDAFATPSTPLPNKVGRVVLVVNPMSGNRRGAKAAAWAEPKLREAGVDVRVLRTERAGHAAELAAGEDLADVDAVVAVGGDGTLHEVVNGLMRRGDSADVRARVALGVIPAGSGNTVAYSTKAYSAETALEQILRGHVRNFDVIELTPPGGATAAAAPLYAVNVVGWAMPSKIMKTANDLRCLGFGALYNTAIYMFILTNKTFRGKITYVTDADETKTIAGQIALLSVNTTVHIGSRTPVSPEAKIDDGLLDLTVVTKSNVAHNMRTMALAERGKHPGRRGITQAKVKEVLLEPGDGRLTGPGSVNVDGEMTGYAPVRVRVVPAAFKLLC